MAENSGWAIAPAGAPAGNTGPLEFHVNVAASTEADTMYWFQRKPPPAVVASPGHVLFGAASDSVKLVACVPDAGDRV